MPIPEIEKRLDERALEALVAEGGWTRASETLTRTFRCRGWKDAIAFVDRIAVAADEANHHPDVHVEGYRNVRIVLSTHATGTLSDADIGLARHIDALHGPTELTAARARFRPLGR